MILFRFYDIIEPYFVFLFIYEYCCIVTDVIVTEPDVLRLIFIYYYCSWCYRTM